MFNNRQSRDVERLTGRRGDTEQRSVLWNEIDALSQKIADKLITSSFGGAIGKYVTAASIDEDELDRLLPLQNTIQQVNQDIDSANTYIQNEADRLDDADAAIVSDVDALTLRVGDAETAITSEATARSDGDTALAQQISTVEADLNTAEAAVTQNASAIATIESYQAATYTLRVDAGDASGSLELVAADDPINGPASAVRIKADNILLDGTVTAPLLNVGYLSAIASDIGTVTAGKVQSADGKFVINLNNKTISITV